MSPHGRQSLRLRALRPGASAGVPVSDPSATLAPTRPQMPPLPPTGHVLLAASWTRAGPRPAPGYSPPPPLPLRGLLGLKSRWQQVTKRAQGLGVHPHARVPTSRTLPVGRAGRGARRGTGPGGTMSLLPCSAGDQTSAELRGAGSRPAPGRRGSQGRWRALERGLLHVPNAQGGAGPGGQA